MVTSVNTNANAMAAVQALTDISNSMATTQSHIESGLKVGGASDNPAIFTIAQGLRGNIQAMQAVSDSLATNVATLQAQSQGATSISNALVTLKQTVTQGQGQTGDALAATNATITNALKNIDAFAQASTINGVNLLATASQMSTITDITGSLTTVSTATASTSAGLGLSGLQISTGGVTLTQGTGAAANDTATFTDNRGNSTTFTFVTSGTAPTAAATTTTGTVGTDGNTYNGAKEVQVVLGANNSATFGNLVSAMQANGISASVDNSGVITVNGGGVTAADKAAASSAGVTTGAVATVTASVVASSATTVGAVATVPGGGSSAIAAVNAAMAQIGRTLSQLGAATLKLQGLADFTSKLSSSTSTSLGAMVDANLSEESAKLSSLQTKQSLAIQSLSLANQGPSSLLQLFR